MRWVMDEAITLPSIAVELDKNMIKDNAKMVGWMAGPIKPFDIGVSSVKDDLKNGILLKSGMIFPIKI